VERLPEENTMRTIDQLFVHFRETGDAAALGQVFDRTAGPLFRLALTLSPDAATAEDALQDTGPRSCARRSGRWPMVGRRMSARRDRYAAAVSSA
jgi:hypothetical protein